MPFSQVERQMALEIYRDRGATAAAAEIGCSRQTVYEWIADELSDNSEKTEAEVAHQDRYRRYLRSHLTRRLLYSAVRFVDRCHEPYTYTLSDGETVEVSEPPGAEVRQLMTAAGIAIDKLRLELGETTARTEHISMDLVDSEIMRLRDELAAHDS